jgi:hypothetical protein
MSRFMTKLRIERIEDQSRDGRGTWRLIDPLAYESDATRERLRQLSLEFFPDSSLRFREVARYRGGMVGWLMGLEPLL